MIQPLGLDRDLTPVLCSGQNEPFGFNFFKGGHIIKTWIILTVFGLGILLYCANIVHYLNTFFFKKTRSAVQSIFRNYSARTTCFSQSQP